MATYDFRDTDYQKAHGFTDEMLDTFIDGFALQDGERFLELMAGNGMVTQRAMRRFPGLDCQFHVMDAYGAQLPTESRMRVIEEDVRLADLFGEQYDVAAMKNGIHEIKKHQQRGVFANIYHLIKPGGRLHLWELALKNKKEQFEYQDVVRRKDELAGFTDFVTNRYFLSLPELLVHLDSVGFVNIGIEHDMEFLIDTKNWLENDFAHNQGKLDEFNDYVRNHHDFEDHGTHLSKSFYWPIVTATRPGA